MELEAIVVAAGVMGADALPESSKQVDDARAEVWVERSEEVLVAASEEGKGARVRRPKENNITR